MQKKFSESFRNQKRSGVVLLIGLLVTVVLGMIFYYIAIRGPGMDMETGEQLENPPWQQWKDVEKHLHREDLGVGEPYSEQPDITKTMKLDANVYEDEEYQKGSIGLIFKPDYTIEGGWGGTYYTDPNRTREHQGRGKVKGYLIPDETMLDIESEDYETGDMYFLTQGYFTIIEYRKARVRKVGGSIYVSGWLTPDYFVKQGQVVITSDYKRFESFAFEGQAEEFEMKDTKFLAEQYMKKMKAKREEE